MEEHGANSKRFPKWLITTDTMQKCNISPENKKKLLPDCKIMEITHDEIDRALKKMADPGKHGLSSWSTPLTPGT
jgi:hypothetical protein